MSRASPLPDDQPLLDDSDDGDEIPVADDEADEEYLLKASALDDNRAAQQPVPRRSSAGRFALAALLLAVAAALTYLAARPDGRGRGGGGSGPSPHPPAPPTPPAPPAPPAPTPVDLGVGDLVLYPALKRPPWTSVGKPRYKICLKRGSKLGKCHDSFVYMSFPRSYSPAKQQGKSFSWTTFEFGARGGPIEVFVQVLQGPPFSEKQCTLRPLSLGLTAGAWYADGSTGSSNHKGGGDRGGRIDEKGESESKGERESMPGRKKLQGIHFTIDRPMKVSIECLDPNGQSGPDVAPRHQLMIFADPIDSFKPPKTPKARTSQDLTSADSSASISTGQHPMPVPMPMSQRQGAAVVRRDDDNGTGHLIYYPPGIYNISERTMLRSNTLVYIAGGAWVRGSFATSANSGENRNISIRGRGVLSGELIQPAGHASSERAGINMCGTDVTVEGVVVVNMVAYMLQINAPWWCDRPPGQALTPAPQEQEQEQLQRRRRLRQTAEGGSGMGDEEEQEPMHSDSSNSSISISSSISGRASWGGSRRHQDRQEKEKEDRQQQRDGDRTQGRDGGRDGDGDGGAPMTMIPASATGALVRNVKLVGWDWVTDGVFAGRRALVEDSFVKANDDSIKAYLSHLMVRRCTVWQLDNGFPFMLSWNTNSDETNITVKDTTVIHVEHDADASNLGVGNPAVFGAVHGGEGKLDAIRFENVVVEGPVWRAFAITVQPNQFAPASSKQGVIENISFSNIVLLNQNTRAPVASGGYQAHNELFGTGPPPAGGYIGRVYFDDVHVRGRRMHNYSEANFDVKAGTVETTPYDWR